MFKKHLVFFETSFQFFADHFHFMFLTDPPQVHVVYVIEWNMILFLLRTDEPACRGIPLEPIITYTVKPM
jgi:hypothetical protein